jgi:hypothetical protein
VVSVAQLKELPAPGRGLRGKAWQYHHPTGPDLDDPIYLETAWDECDDPDFSERMPMRPTLRPVYSEWDDLGPIYLIGEHANRRLRPEVYNDGLDVAAEIEAYNERVTAKRLAADAEHQRKLRAEALRIKEARAAKRRREAEREELRAEKARKAARKARRRAEEARADREALPAPRVCTCGHAATAHGRSGVCLEPVPGANGINYICPCTDLAIRSAS